MPALLITFIRTYTFASYIAGFGVYIILISKMLLTGYLSKLISKDAMATTPLKVIDFTQIAGNIGIACYLFEGNGVIMNVKAETKNQHLYHRILILAVTMLCAIVVFISGIVYYVYREETSTMFTFNLQPMNPLVSTIIIGFCFATFPSYPGTILAVFDMIE